jgi:hypothetical protein
VTAPVRATPGNAAGAAGEMTSVSTPTPGAPGGPTETDRLIAATRDEARKTRTLLLWLLVGLPVIGAVIWGLVAAGAAGSNGSSADSGAIPVIDTNAPNIGGAEPAIPDTPAETTTTPIAVTNFTITDTTMCSAIADWENDLGNQELANPADAAIQGGSAYRGEEPIDVYLTSKGDNAPGVDIGPFLEECGVHTGAQDTQDETVLTAWEHIQHAP